MSLTGIEWKKKKQVQKIMGSMIPFIQSSRGDRTSLKW